MLVPGPGAGETDGVHSRLLFVIHHLAVDGVSWRILLGDLEAIFTGLEGGLSLIHI